MDKSKKVETTLCVLFGFLGIHKFYMGKIGMGFLYLFTIGLAGIGWVVDSIKLLIELFSLSNTNKKIKEDNKTVKISKKEEQELLLKKEAEERAAKRKLFLRNEIDKFNSIIETMKPIDVVLSKDKIERNTISSMPEIKLSSLRKGMAVSNLMNFVVIDTETTGLKAHSNDIVELAVVRFVEFEPVEYMVSLVKPRKPITEEVTKINNISNSDVENAPLFYEICPSFMEFIGDSNIVAHNLSFDIKFLYASGMNLFNPKRKFYDTLDISQKLLKRYDDRKADRAIESGRDYYDYDVLNHKLDTICDYYGIHRDNSHRALSDALATGLIFIKLVEEKLGNLNE